MNPPVRTVHTPDPIDEILRRIARVESEGQGGYAARGPVITRGAYRGQRAAGMYQIMPGNLPAWSREALGREVSLDEFLANPDLQERIARHRVSAYYDQYGNVADVASVWHSGRPLREAGSARDQNMTTREYVSRVTGAQQAPAPGLEARIAAGRELRRRGALSPAQDAALAELERRASAGSAATVPSSSAAPVPIVLDEAGQPLPGQTRGEAELAALRMAEGGTPGAEGDTENTIRLHTTYDPNNPGEVSSGPIGQARAKWERGETLSADEAEVLGFPSPEKARRAWEAEQARARGAASIRPDDREGFNAAALVQGFGSGFFGLGTPAGAVGEMIASRLDSDPGESSWGEALQFIRGRRDELEQLHPHEFYAGMAGSLIGGVGATRALARAAPRAASVFTLQSGQTARNIARLSAAGAGYAGVTALNEEGAGAAPGGAALGAVAGPAFVGAGSAALGGARAITSRINSDNAAIRLLARRLGEPVAALQRRYDEFVATRGRPPRLAEIVRRETAEELGQMGRVRSEAGGVFRQAEGEATAVLPGELAPLVRNGGTLGSEPAAAARRAATTAEAAEVMGRRVQSSVVRQVGQRGTQDGGQRGRAMDALMNRVGDHRVPITGQMMAVVEDPDLMGALEPAVRRGVRREIEAAGVGGTPYLRVRDWDTIRRELGRRAGTENGRRYAQLRNEVRDYVSSAVPEYGRGLQEYARRSATAQGTVFGSRVLTQSTREFVDLLRSIDPATMVGARVGARTALANALGGEPAKAERFMERLARDAGMRARVRLALRDDEVRELERLAERYGHQLDFSAGLRTGRSITRQNDTEAFQEAVAQANQVERVGVRQGARAALVEAAGESPATASRTAQRMAEDPGLQTRIETALGGGERQRLTTLGRSVTESQARLAEAVPGDAALARARADEHADGIRQVIRGTAAMSGRGGGGFVSAFVGEMLQKVRIPKVAARRLAEMAVDPARAHVVIARLRRAGVRSEEILRMYQNAAAAAGVQAGRAQPPVENGPTLQP